MSEPSELSLLPSPLLSSPPPSLLSTMAIPTMVLIGLGANLGDRRRTLERAVERIDETPGCRLVTMSKLRDTKPVLRNPGDPPVPDYFNGVAVFETTLGLRTFFDRMMAVEHELGRPPRPATPETKKTNSATNEGTTSPEPAWEPRTCDLDLLLFGEQVCTEPDMTIPHPRMHQRRFVLEPAMEIAPSMQHPLFNVTLEQIFHTSFPVSS